MAEKDMGCADLAKIMGVSAQNIFVYFKRDYMKLSVAQEMASRLGFKLGFTLEKEAHRPHRPPSWISRAW